MKMGVVYNFCNQTISSLRLLTKEWFIQQFIDSKYVTDIGGCRHVDIRLTCNVILFYTVSGVAINVTFIQDRLVG